MTILTRIELAFGADLTANPATWTWTDVSVYALGSISVTAGRSDEASQTRATQCAFRLRNTDGRFSPRLPSSPYWPNVRRQTPVRVSLNPGTGYVQRFQGGVDDITPSWPSGNSDYAEVSVTASGSLRRLGQGTKPLRSALYRANTAAGAAAYWACEDAASSTQGAVVSGGSALMPFGQPNFGSTLLSIPGSAGSVDLRGDFANLITDVLAATVVPTPFSATSWQLEFVAGYATAVVGTTRLAVGIETDLSVGGSFLGVALPTSLWDGRAHHFAYQLTKSGADISMDVFFDGVFDHNTVIAATPLGRPTTVRLNPQFLNGDDIPIIAHVALFATFSSPAQRAAALSGYTGETAGARVSRLCTEQGVPSSVSSTTGTTPMGPQTVSTFISLVRECETADGGILYDGAGPGLNYLARKDRYNPPVSLALDTKRQQVKLPFAPVEDDQRVRNDWTVSRPGGGFPAQFTDPVHVAANGRYDSSVSINVPADPDLPNQAAWRVHLGTVEEMRVPGLSLQLIDRPELWAAWLATTLGERITAANLPAQYPPGILDMIVEGYTETWDSASWKVDLNTSPYQPWNVAALGTTFRLEMAGQTLNSNLVAAATSLSLATATGHTLFTTTATFPADFPMDLNVAGWQIHVTAASGTSSPQTLTIDPAPNTSPIPAGTAVTLWRPAVLAL